jgi:hypothetical protein
MVIIGLGRVWILDGLEVTIVGNISEPGRGLSGAKRLRPLPEPEPRREEGSIDDRDREH